MAVVCVASLLTASCTALLAVAAIGIGSDAGSASIACLKRNITTLSGACRQALGAVAGISNTAATAAVTTPPAEPAPLLVTPRDVAHSLRRRLCQFLPRSSPRRRSDSGLPALQQR
jgi:hypothetical protein